jgi:Protein of unknown function (DUF2920)
MAKNHQLKIPAHYNIYNGNNDDRYLDIYFSEPDNGVNEKTGLLMLITGFGAHSQSKVYKKMREVFADMHNLVVIQCDYFGSEFMQASKSQSFNLDTNQLKSLLTENDFQAIIKSNNSVEEILKVLSKYECTVTGKETLNESLSNFNDMGFMQALDVLTALYAVKIILKDNNLNYNKSKVIAYGHSHGAYLAYLCNRIAPNDFTLIIDNSAWIKPVYLSTPRYLFNKVGNMVLQTEFDYLCRGLRLDNDALDLNNLYDGFNNQAQIYSIHGIDDKLVNYAEKRTFVNKVDISTFKLITSKEIDRKVFFSTSHGLQADFLELFNDIIPRINFTKKQDDVTVNTQINGKQKCYKTDFSSGLPVMKVEE